jgi:hypothetical protein
MSWKIYMGYRADVVGDDVDDEEELEGDWYYREDAIEEVKRLLIDPDISSDERDDVTAEWESFADMNDIVEVEDEGTGEVIFKLDGGTAWYRVRRMSCR